jgi:hypothetical protein
MSGERTEFFVLSSLVTIPLSVSLTQPVADTRIRMVVHTGGLLK